MLRILNNILRWDGTHLGEYRGVIKVRWEMGQCKYYGIVIPKLGEEEGGIIYCIGTKTDDVLACIVEDIKDIFGLERRGIHRIKIDGKEHLIYYVPISTVGEVIWETPLNRLDGKHTLRKDEYFKKEIQRILMVSDIMGLMKTGETSIWIRPGSEGRYVPISINETKTEIVKETKYDYSILPKTLFLKWFGEHTDTDDIVKEMVYSRFMKRGNIPIIVGDEGDNLSIIMAEIRNKVERVIKKYDSGYLWYTNFIIDRMTRHIVPE